MFRFLNVSDVSSSVSAALPEVDPLIGSLVTLGAFTITIVIFAAFLTIVRKNKNQMK
ncbi:MAG: hypothetical protein IJB88_08570 [Clostridia bacterium]|nr:hypothetical protein [Clostridia bacterium]